MDVHEAKRIGSRQALISVGAGLLIAQLIMTLLTSSQGFLKAFFWFFNVEFKLHIVVGAIIMLACGHFVGQMAGRHIIIRKRNFVIVGALSGIAVLVITAFLSGWLGFFQEGIDNIGTGDDPFEDYIFKPFFWITIFGIVPASFVGVWFGWRIKRRSVSLPL